MNKLGEKVKEILTELIHAQAGDVPDGLLIEQLSLDVAIKEILKVFEVEEK